MKKLVLICFSFFALILCFSLLSWADPPEKKLSENQKKQMKQEPEHRKHPEEMKRQEPKHGEVMERKYSKHHPDFSKYPGYREQPYGKNRHYVEYVHKGHRYDYQGHWRSWEEWDRYAKEHTNIDRDGKYYREGAHLMFRFCQPGTANCFFFSIGR